MASKHLVRGILAGVTGGLVASWMMNEFATTVGQKISDTIETPADKQELAAESDGQDATMRAADKIVETVTGGRHLTYEQREIGGPIVHYTMGAVTGGIYGALAEYLPIARAGFGTTFGGILFSTADVFGVPALGPVARPISPKLVGKPAGLAPGLWSYDGTCAPRGACDSLAHIGPLSALR